MVGPAQAGATAPAQGRSTYDFGDEGRPDEQERKRARTEDMLTQMMSVISEQQKVLQEMMQRMSQPESSRANPPAPSAEVQPGPRREVADAEVPPEIKKAITKLGRNFEGDVRKYLSMQDKVAQAKKDVEFMKQEGLRYPAGTRPFKSPQELADLDTVIPECANQPMDFIVKLDTGTTRRQALAKIHHSFTKFYKQCMAKALEVQMEAKKQVTTRQAFLEKCKTVVGEAMQTQKCGLEDSTIPEVPAEASLQYAEGTYHTLITRLRKMKTDEAKEQEKRAEKEKKTKDEMCKREPAVLLKDLVGELVQQNMAETRPMETETTQDPQAKKVDEFVQALQKPKNGDAPRGGAGNPKQPRHNPRPTPRKPKHIWWHGSQSYAYRTWQPQTPQTWRAQGGKPKGWSAYGHGGGRSVRATNW